jgi:4-amino-4-deoxy-L-arabinose transferase-like glycosyltransferase
LIAGIGESCGAPRAGRLGAWIFVFYPAAVWTTATVVWDTTLTALVLTLLVYLLLKHGRRVGTGRAFAFGALIGAGLLVSASLLVLLPIAVVASVGRPFAWRRLSANGLGLAAGVALVTLPWIARNASVLGAASLRTNLGVELNAGNNDLADGRMQHAYHPSLEPVETARYLEIGEVAYCAEARERSIAWIRENPALFARVSLRRMQLWWLGEDPFDDPRTEGPMRARDDWRNWVRWVQHAFCGALAIGGAALLAWRGTPGRMLLALLVLFPLPYYVTHIYERYRFPIEPVIVFLASWLACEAYAAAHVLVSTRPPRAARSIPQEG